MKKLLTSLALLLLVGCGGDDKKDKTEIFTLSGTWRSIDQYCAREVIFYEDRQFTEVAYCVDQKISHNSTGIWSTSHKGVVYLDYFNSNNESYRGVKYSAVYRVDDEQISVNGPVNTFTLRKVTDKKIEKPQEPIILY